MHLKRNKIPKFWPIPRKGTKYLALANHNQKESIPLLIVLRDILKLVRNKKELKKVLNEGQIKVNQKKIQETNFPLGLFDIIHISTTKKNYQINLSKNKKISLKEIFDKEAETKIFKVENKKILRKNQIQLNLMGGKNIISTKKILVGESIVLELKNNKIVEIIPFKEGEKVLVIKGKHQGYFGKISKIKQLGNKKIAEIIFNGTTINVWNKNLIMIK